MIPIIFHITAGSLKEILATHPHSKIIQTILLLVLATVIVVKKKYFSFRLPAAVGSEEPQHGPT